MYSRMDQVKFLDESLLKNGNGYGLAKADDTPSIFKRLSSTIESSKKQL